MDSKVNPALLRKSWPLLSKKAKDLFAIHYDTQDCVSEQRLKEELNVNSVGLRSVRAWIDMKISAANGGGYFSASDCFQWDTNGYRLRDQLRPVVGELLEYHTKEKTILLQTLWTIGLMFESLERHIDSIPGDEIQTFSINLRTHQQELDSLLQDLLKPSKPELFPTKQSEK